MEKKVLYTTKEWNGYGKQNYYCNQYRLEKDEVVKYKCNRQKTFDGKESSWSESERKVDSWKKNDGNMPEWLKKFL